MLGRSHIACLRALRLLGPLRATPHAPRNTNGMTRKCTRARISGPWLVSRSAVCLARTRARGGHRGGARVQLICHFLFSRIAKPSARSTVVRRAYCLYQSQLDWWSYTRDKSSHIGFVFLCVYTCLEGLCCLMSQDDSLRYCSMC